MKNTLLLNCTKILWVALIATALITTKSNAQNGDAAFNKGDNVIGISAGVGVDYGYGTYYGGHYTNLPAICLTFDHGTFEDVGPGNIGIGGIIGFKYSYYNYNDNNHNNNSYRNTYTNFIIAARGTYHLTLLKDKNSKFDPYAGITLGVRIFTHHYDNPYYNKAYDNYNSVYAVKGVFIGAKYNFSPHVGVFGEFGYDISFARVGLNFNF